MPVAWISYDRTAIAGRKPRATAWRILLRALARAVDRLVPPPSPGGSPDLPAAWFKHPPF